MPSEEHKKYVFLFVSQTMPKLNWEEVMQESSQNKQLFSFTAPDGNKNRIESRRASLFLLMQYKLQYTDLKNL